VAKQIVTAILSSLAIGASLVAMPNDSQALTINSKPSPTVLTTTPPMNPTTAKLETVKPASKTLIADTTCYYKWNRRGQYAYICYTYY
jgi:hypothetical protein